MQTDAFGEKLLSKLDKLDPNQVQVYLARLRDQKQFMQEIFDHLDEGVVVADSQLQLLFANRRSRLMLGWPRDKRYIGDDLGERIAPGHPLHEIINSLRSRFRAIEGYECAYGRPQDDRILSLSTLPMHARGFGDEDGEEQLLILLMHDVTERRKREAEQARARRLASLATLTSGIAHEIKNPLNSLNIHAQLLQAEVAKSRGQGRRPDLERTDRASRVILEETARLTRIVEDFIQAARPRTPMFEEGTIAEMLKRVEEVFSPECAKLGIQWQMHLDPELPPLMIDEHLFIQALRNLLRNGIDALTERSRHEAGDRDELFEPRLSLSARLDGHFVTLTVEDNGHGIAEGELEHIFEPYYTTKFGGSGLGLMVVYRIVTEHRGRLHVDSQPGQSTRFIISLPLEKLPVRLLGHQPEEQNVPVTIGPAADLGGGHHPREVTVIPPEAAKTTNNPRKKDTPDA